MKTTNKFYNKILKNYFGRSPFGDKLTRDESFDLEMNCLTLINSNFQCICHNKSTHFPKLIEFDKKQFKLLLSNCGTSIDKLNHLQKKNIIVYNLDKQLDCIIHNLKNANVQHRDMHLSGKNICIDNNGIISIIDFDLARITDSKKHSKFYTELRKKIKKAIIYNNIKYIL